MVRQPGTVPTAGRSPQPENGSPSSHLLPPLPTPQGAHGRPHSFPTSRVPTATSRTLLAVLEGPLC